MCYVLKYGDRTDVQVYINIDFGTSISLMAVSESDNVNQPIAWKTK